MSMDLGHFFERCAEIREAMYIPGKELCVLACLEGQTTLTWEGSKTHLKYGSSAKAFWITSIAPGMSASVRGTTSTVMIVFDRLITVLELVISRVIKP
jgi:hypothetical protein